MLTDLRPTSEYANGFAHVNGVNHNGKVHLPHVDSRSFLDEQVLTPESVDLGPAVVRTDIRSSIGPFTSLPEYRTQYPPQVSGAIGELFSEYNVAFQPLVEANREWETDYQYTRTGPGGASVNRWVQIDMVGLPQGFLNHAAQVDQATIREALRGRIFEIENSLAMYQLLERIHSNGSGLPTRFAEEFRSSLDGLRQRYNRRIALLAVTDQKYQAMKESEFGKATDEPLVDDEVHNLSGFDKFFGPSDFLEHLSQSGGESDYLLYVRSSDPVAKLRKPETLVSNPLLEDDDVRRAIKASAITFNIDRPGLPLGSEARINDTKAYMITMGMAHRADSIGDVLTLEQINGHETPRIILNDRLGDFLAAQGVDPEAVSTGARNLRTKPMQASYGCYGHIVLRTGVGKDRQEFKRGMNERGPYVVQPELETPLITNQADGQLYTYIDRNFFVTDGIDYRFMGGFRSLMPVETVEAKQKRVHGNTATVWAEVS